jgi:hypothetical protein
VSGNSTVSVGNDPNKLAQSFEAMKVSKAGSSYVVPPHVQKVNLPHTLLQIKDVQGQEFARVEIHLLSGMTSDSIHPFVDQSGKYLYVKYFLPDVCADPERLDSNDTQDGEWVVETNLPTVAVAAAREVQFDFKNDRIHCIQRIKLPFLCKRKLAVAYGRGSYVKMVEHEDPDFKRNKQMYYYLVVNLEAVEEPAEISKEGPSFVLSPNPSTRSKVNPFAAMVTDPVRST